MRKLWKKLMFRGNAAGILLRRGRTFLRREEGAGRSGALLVRWDRVGDAVVWLPYATALIEHFHARGEPVALLCQTGMADFLRRTLAPDEVIELDLRAWFDDPAYRKKLLDTVARRRFAVLCNPRAAREFLVDDLIAAAAECPAAYAVDCPGRAVNPFLQKFARFCYSDPVRVAPDASETAVAEAVNRAVTGSAAGSPKPCAGLRELPGPAIPGRYYVVLPGSCDPFRCWPVENYRALIRELSVDAPFLTPVVAGAEGEFPPEGGDGKILDLTGKTTLEEFAGLLANAEFVIGNESGGIHLAAAAGRPGFCLAGFGHWRRFIPYPEPYPVPGVVPPVLLTAAGCPYAGCNWKCRYFTAEKRLCPCIDDIPAAAVLEAVRNHLAGTAAGSEEGNNDAD